ncbi:addiction module protein [Undibacterium flavidum]|uniref:Addiction module protein n=1 Tax=Undibacterium flavidum TaxID=2762297 RepID=A0ABR6YG93_9BURK|nr:addiction module protein [Undibacterium flavidum]MBC3875562.1 addiction module protein [Undibacterium flavidum]
MCALFEEIQQFDIAALPSNFTITDAQKAELDRRLAKRASEKSIGVSLDQIAQKLGVTI